MTLRRDFLAFTAGAVAARTILPIGARAEAAHERQSSVCEQGAFACVIVRVKAGASVEETVALFRRELLAREPVQLELFEVAA